MKRSVYRPCRVAQVIVITTAVALCGALQGCGGGDGDTDAAARIPFPDRPQARECPSGGTDNAVDASRAPVPGVYRYQLDGTEVAVGSGASRQRLPSSMQVVVTPALERAGSTCFRLQRRLRPSLVETATFIVNGEDVYVSELAIATLDATTALAPRPPLLAVDSSNLEWSAAFSGNTRGRYVGKVLGRRRVRIDGEPVPAIGVEVRASFAGRVTGTQRSEQWFSARDHLLLTETNVERRRFGLEDLSIRYTARLKSLRPRGRS